MGYLTRGTKSQLLVCIDPEIAHFMFEAVKMLTWTICDSTCRHNLVFTVNTGQLEVTTELRGRGDAEVSHEAVFTTAELCCSVLYMHLGSISLPFMPRYGSNGK